MTMKSLQIFFVIGFQFIMFCQSLSRISVNQEWLVDDIGRIRIFHGINSVRKSEPWYDHHVLNQTRLELYKKWGFNVIRLGTMWSGIEPEEGKINQTYLNIISGIVDKAGKFNIHTILDMHQDVFSSTACYDCYDGIPKWVGEKFKPALLKYPWPFKEITHKNWFLGYLTLSVSSAFQQFYDNVGGSIDAFVRFWTNISKSFNNNTNVLGYELINEPWAGNVYTNPKLFLPGIAVAENLFHVYERTFREINKFDKETLIFYEPVTWGVYLSGNLTGMGFQKLPGGDEFQNRSVLSYHHYCWLLELKNASGDYSLFLRIMCDNILGAKVFPNVMKSILKTGGSAFYTEFGLCAPDGNPRSINTIECDFIMSKADEYFQSWAYWDSKFFNKRGDPIMSTVKGFSRPYARAIAGYPVKMNFDTKTKIFYFDYVAQDAINGPTEIFIPEVHYSGNVDFDISPNAEWTFDQEIQTLLVTHILSSSPLVNVIVKPRVS